jgi:diaminobutyrate-2-oxoglutarate transaminase
MSHKLIGRTFILFWLSETAFLIGGALTSFALGVWVFEQSGSIRQFAYVMLSSAVPALIFLPFAGLLADRFDRRWVIVWCDCSAVLTVLILAYLAASKLLVVEHLYAFGAIFSIVRSLRNPSYRAAVSLIIPTDKLTRANGMFGVTAGFVQIGAPLSSGYLMATWGIEGVIAIELVMVLAGSIMIFSALTRNSHAILGSGAEDSQSLLNGIQSSFSGTVDYFKEHSLMLNLVSYILIQKALLVFASTMVTPLILSTQTSETLGMVIAFGALGGVTGSLFLIGANVTTRLMFWILTSDIVLAAFLILAGLSSTPAYWSLCAFGAFACGGISEGCAGALWIRKVPKEKLGSVFALIAAGNLIVTCVVMLVGSALVDQVFEPLMMPGAALAESIGAFLGMGKGRGIALLFVLAGSVCALASLVALFHSRVRILDSLVPEQDRSDELLKKNLKTKVVVLLN